MRTGGFKGVLLSTLVMASIMALAIPLLSPSLAHAALTPRAPIYINGNAGFTSPNPVNGGGSGTAGDPYIIENWDISAGSANGIEIWNTTAYFIIRNCYVHDGGTYGAALISLYWVTNGVVDNVLVENSYSSGILLYNSSNNTISNSTAENNTTIFLYNSDNNLIENNTCENSFVGIYLRTYSNNNLIKNNIAENNRLGIEFYEKSNNNIISNNTCSNQEMGISISENSNNNLIDNNLVRNSVYEGIRLNNSSNNTISHNITENNNLGIFLYYSDYNLIDNNLVRNSVNDGIHLYNSLNNTISNNTAEKTRTYHGIDLEYSSNNLLLNNLARNNGYAGIALRWSGNNTVDNNIAESNSNSGIFSYYSDYNLISNNILKKNYFGIAINLGNNNTISNNLVMRNGTGIYITGSSYNNFTYHNNIVNNGFQANAYPINYWDNGYPSGGNYWGDYTGVDENQGENQDIPGSDGIGDTPYNILGGNNLDRYPLMSPFPFRDVGISISPTYRDGPPKAILTYIVMVTNLGTENDNYDLTVSDNAGWGPTLENNLLEVPAGENRQTTLSVTILENAAPCTEDSIMVVATSRADNLVSDTGTCVAHAVSPKAELKLENLYAVSLDVIIWVENGSKLVLKFYTTDNKFENESIIDEFVPPKQVENIEKVPHPQGKRIGRVRLVLTTDNTQNEIYTLASLTVRKDDLGDRIIWIIMNYTGGSEPQKNAWGNEVVDIVMNYTSYPS